ncbi:phage minor head protein [Bacillus thuringiensis]|nr:phage minor head protein [Bacillus thuringiensis]MED2810964.1 phage minor head protein [Bacillus thuringiensis]MED2828920.1 phage minor head protein [Bacillus thuringiensis]MED2852497.1 phage minor head protein [Bacillus thuringiensis]MED2855986.1 phage minor head protein [Bacillus thuringiensis]
MQEMRRFNRYKSMQSELQHVINEITYEKKKTLNETLSNQYGESFYYTSYLIEKEVGVALSYGLLDPNVIKRAVQMPIDKMTLNQRLSTHRVQIVNRIRRELSIGLRKGEGYATMANRIKPILDGDAKKAQMVAWTESARVQNLGTYDSASHAFDEGVSMKKIWISTLDKRTRPTHQAADHQKVPFKGLFKVGGYSCEYPHDSNLPAKEVVRCRCTFITEVADVSSFIERRARNPTTGKNEVISAVSYEEWKESLE